MCTLERVLMGTASLRATLINMSSSANAFSKAILANCRRLQMHLVAFSCFVVAIHWEWRLLLTHAFATISVLV